MRAATFSRPLREVLFERLGVARELARGAPRSAGADRAPARPSRAAFCSCSLELLALGLDAARRRRPRARRSARSCAARAASPRRRACLRLRGGPLGLRRALAQPAPASACSADGSRSARDSSCASSSTLRPISARSARPRRSSASSLRVWLATSPSRRVARAARSHACATALCTSGGALPAGYARDTMREKSAARLAHSMTPGDCGGGGGGGARVLARRRDLPRRARAGCAAAP